MVGTFLPPPAPPPPVAPPALAPPVCVESLFFSEEAGSWVASGGGVGQGPRGRGRTVFSLSFLSFFFSSFCVPRPFWRTANPTALTLAPLSDLIGSDITLFKSALLWLASGEGQAARGQGHAQGIVGHALFCFFSSEGVGSLRGLPASGAPSPTPTALPCCRNPIHVDQPCLTLFVSRRLHFAASFERAAPLGCCRDSGKWRGGFGRALFFFL